MTAATQDAMHWLAHSAHEPFAYLTTIGRRTGQPHRIEIWFAVEDGLMYLLSGGRERSDWVRNLQTNPYVTVELGGKTRAGQGRTIEPGTPEDGRARELLVSKYQQGGNLDEWGRSSLPVVVAFLDDVAATSASGGSQRVS